MKSNEMLCFLNKFQNINKQLVFNLTFKYDNQHDFLEESYLEYSCTRTDRHAHLLILL